MFNEFVRACFPLGIEFGDAALGMLAYPIKTRDPSSLIIDEYKNDIGVSQVKADGIGILRGARYFGVDFARLHQVDWLRRVIIVLIILA